jgi:hypothetical protein
MHGFQDPASEYSSGYGRMMPAYQQEPHPMSKKDKNKLKKEEKKQELRQLRERMMQKKADTLLTYANSNVKAIMGLASTNAFLLIVCMCGNSWKWRAFRGFGMKALWIKTSLYHVHVEFECGKNWLEDKVCKFFERLNGVHSLQEFAHLSCVMGEHACTTMRHIYYGSFIIFLTFSTAVLFQLAGVLFLHFYWYTIPLAKIRKYALVFMTAGPCIMVIGLGFWAFATPDLAEIPRGWVELMSSYTGNSILSYKTLNDLQFGWSFCLAVFLVLCMTVQVFMFSCAFRAHWRETQTELEEEQARDQREADLFMHEEGIHEDELNLNGTLAEFLQPKAAQYEQQPMTSAPPSRQYFAEQQHMSFNHGAQYGATANMGYGYQGPQHAGKASSDPVRIDF